MHRRLASSTAAHRVTGPRPLRAALASTLALVLAFALALAGCAASAGRTPRVPGPAFGADHPLTGHLWSPAASIFVSDGQLTRMLADARIVLLGEQHDNPEHHRLQAFVLERMAAIGRRPVLVFEMIDRDRQQAVDACRAAPRCRAADLAVAAEWNERGWPDWRMYGPVLDRAANDGLLVIAGGLGRPTLREVVKSGTDVLEPELRARLDVERPLGRKTRTAMVEEIRVSHCGYPPEQLIDGMVTAQRLKDAYMAAELASAQVGGTAVLIAGNGHARNDWGVPSHLRRATPLAARLTIAMVEVREGLDDPRAYAEMFGTAKLPFDLVWFTARVDETDPCEQFKEQLEKMRAP